MPGTTWVMPCHSDRLPDRCRSLKTSPIESRSMRFSESRNRKGSTSVETAIAPSRIEKKSEQSPKESTHKWSLSAVLSQIMTAAFEVRSSKHRHRWRRQACAIHPAPTVPAEDGASGPLDVARGSPATTTTRSASLWNRTSCWQAASCRPVTSVGTTAARPARSRAETPRSHPCVEAAGPPRTARKALIDRISPRRREPAGSVHCPRVNSCPSSHDQAM